MTTVLSKTSEFVSVDSRWTDSLGQIVHTKMRKYVYADGELYFFSGDHLPILVEQAFSIDVIGEDDFFRFLDMLDENEVFGQIVMQESNGHVVFDDKVTFDWYEGLSYTGSGGKFAAEFYHHARKHRYESKYGCNIEGALRHAFYWDAYSGERINKRIWQPSIFDNTLQTDLNYKNYIGQEIDTYLRGGQMTTKLKSAMRTSPNPNGSKISLSEAKQRIERRKARLEERNSSK